MKYYSVEELILALEKAREIINNKTKQSNKFIFGYNDCFNFLVEYDKALRKELSQVSSIINFKYNSPFKFIFNLRKNGHNLNSLAVACNYEIQSKPKPIIGDIGFISGAAVIASPEGWVTTDEKKNSGIHKVKFDINQIDILARPLRS